MFVIELSDTGNAGKSIETEGRGNGLLRNYPPSLKSLVGLADVAWNWPFTVPRHSSLK